ncbi:MAG: D-2-hydroxyacid dehydrogenase [Halieaceae bacterium]|jgi:phosphoglycerate dehydrogenase-like enzyme|nr:D-2-hydroxyacid dehydrogenase [Halieaceae bacterium]
MVNILVLSPHAERYRELIEREQLPEAALNYACELETALPLAADCEVLFGAPDLIAAILPECPALKWAQSSWAGITPLLECKRRDYRLTGVKDIFGAPMTEFVLGWLLALERNIPQRYAAIRWDDSRDGHIAGKTIGIMGTGSIGAHLAAHCQQLGLTTRGLNSDGRAVAGFDRCWATGERLEFARDLDYLVALLPDTPATDRLVDAALLASLADGAILVNGGRGNSVHTPDLLAALADGRLRHAVLDVLPEEPLADDDPLWSVERLSITSHTAAPTPGRAIVEVFTGNYRRYLAGEPLHYEVDFERGY